MTDWVDEHIQSQSAGEQPDLHELMVKQHKLIRASAGSGKTYELSSRYVSLLNQGASPQSILATTFTRKAAGEILGRVLLRLARAARDAQAASEIGQAIQSPAFTTAQAQGLLASLCRDLHRVNISTLDAFFGKMAGSFKLELDLPLTPSMVSPGDPQAARARLDAIHALITESDLQVMVDLLRRLHHDHAERSVTQSLNNIIASLYDLYRDAPQEAVWSSLLHNEVLAGLLEDDRLEVAIASLARLAQDDAQGKQSLKSIVTSLELAQQRDWQEFLKKGYPEKIATGQLLFNRKPISEEIQDVYRPLIAHAKAVLVEHVARQTHATWQLLERFDGQFTQLRRARSLVLFSDMPLKLARELPAFSDLDAPGLDAIYYRLDGQIAHLLLDEFQDTSPTQWQVLRPLAQEIVAQPLEGRSFFCVGDIKQSIYNWRGGCAELFEQVTEQLSLPDAVQESRNASWRTSQQVLDVVNRVFGHLMDSPLGQGKSSTAIIKQGVEKWMAGFISHTANRNLPGHVKLVTSSRGAGNTSDDAYAEDDTDDDSLDDGQSKPIEPHMLFAADYIRGLAQAHPGRSIGVLVRTNKTVNHLIHQLQKMGLSASGEGGNPVTDDPAVELILSALLLADHPGDSVALHHVRQSPWGVVLPLQDQSPMALERFSSQVRHNLMVQGYPAVVAGWASELARFGDDRNTTRLSQLIELAEAYQPLASTRPRGFVEFVQATPVEEPLPAKVRVMTVHKSKGLEFDVVVLPELRGVMARMRGQEANVFRPTPTDPPAAIYRGTNQVARNACPELTLAYEQSIASRLQDDLCAFYVAMTRARQALHLLIPPLEYTPAGNISSKGLDDLSPAAVLRHLLSEVDETPDASQVLFESGDSAWDQSSTTATPAEPLPRQALGMPAVTLPTQPSPTRSWRIVAPSSLEAGAQVHVADLLNLTNQQGRQYGSIVHALFQQVSWLGDANQPVDLAAIRAAALAQMPEIKPQEIDALLPGFESMLQQPGVVAALRMPNPNDPGGSVELWRERFFAVRLDGMLLRGIMDRVVIHRHAQGQATAAHLLDYKTDRVDETRSVEDIVNTYRPQIKAYQRALAILLDLPVDAIGASLLLTGQGREVAVV